jgi:MGT family glycosyltransferase
MILCYPMPERGHFYPFFQVAKQLQSRGHRVVFLGPADLRDHAVAEGFDFLCVLEDLLPQGYLQKREATLSGTSGISRLRHLIRYQKEITRVFEQTILHGATDAAIEKLGPDLILAEAFVPAGALVAHRLGIPALLLSVTYPSVTSPRVPPPQTGYTPRSGTGTIRASWSALAFKQSIQTLLGLRIPLREIVRKFARQEHFRLPADAFRTSFYVNLALPQLIALPQCLDFPRLEDDRFIYLGPSVDADRKHASFPWDRLDDRPIIYCSMGSSAYHCSRLKQVFEMVMACVGSLKEFQLVLVLSNVLQPGNFSRVPDNAILVQSAPQMEILKRSRLMIAHGGIGTIKEGLLSGVPMILLPYFFDQPGNAARVAFHGIGITADINRLSAAKLSALIAAALSDESMKERIRTMKDRLLQEQSRDVGADAIEMVLEQPDLLRTPGALKARLAA